MNYYNEIRSCPYLLTYPCVWLEQVKKTTNSSTVRGGLQSAGTRRDPGMLSVYFKSLCMFKRIIFLYFINIIPRPYTEPVECFIQSMNIPAHRNQ